MSNRTEEEMRDTKVPTLNTLDELRDYIAGLVAGPHDYGTCVYAMSMAATAAFNHVARALGVTGFQASCADMDILRRTRGLEWGKILDYTKLLYPQYYTSDSFPTIGDLLDDPKVLAELGKRAAKMLEQSPTAHPNVVAHWKQLVNRAKREEARS